MLIMVILPHRNSSKWTLYSLILIVGILSAPRCITGYNYVTELWPSRNLSTSGTTLHFFEGLVVILLSVFYMQVSKHWQPVFLYGISSGFVFTIICLFLIPESPKWLYSKQKYAQCGAALSKLAKYNGIKDTPLID